MDLKSDIEGADLIQRGRAFHKLGAATEKARSPLHFSLDFGMLNNLWFDDRRDKRGRCSVNKSDR